MEITNVHVLPNRVNKSNVKAFCQVTFDDVFVVKNLVVVTDSEGYHYVNMPSKTLKNGTRLDIAHPITESFRKYIEDKVLVEFERVLNELLNSPKCAE